MEKIRMLVIACNCISETTADGRTLKNALSCFKNKSQIYFRGCPDSDACESYLDIVQKKTVEPITNLQMTIKKHKNYKRNLIRPSTLFLRNIMWNNIKIDKELDKWIMRYNPNIILVQINDISGVLNVALKIHKKYNIPMVTLNYEDYYFRKFNYYKVGTSIGYHLFITQFRKNVDKLMKTSKLNIYNSNALASLYSSQFAQQNSVISYMCSDIEERNIELKKGISTISYLGNLTLGRWNVLIDIADVLSEINDKLYISVFGNGTKEVINLLEQHPNIRYFGVITYQEVINQIYASDLIIAGESQEKQYYDELNYAFSTKIADYLKSGIPFLFYSSSKLKLYNYLKENRCAFVVKDKMEIKETLCKIIDSIDFKYSNVENARQVANLNHSSEKNGKALMDEVVNVLQN